MFSAENRSYSPTDEGKSDRLVVLKSGKIPFSSYTDSFRKAFNSGPDTTFEVYNPSASFINPPYLYRAVRVDSSDGVTKSVIFKYTKDGLRPHLERTFDLEDPFVVNIDGEIIFGGVEVDKSLDADGEPVSRWRTILRRGKTIPELRPFFIGPEGMKDIRPIKTLEGGIGVYTRPRSPGNKALGENGQVGYREFGSLDDLEKSDPSALEIQNAPLLHHRFEKSWGGVNHVQLVTEGKFRGFNLALIHEAYCDEDDLRHYSAGGLLHNPKTDEIINLGTLVKRIDLPEGPWKGQGKEEEKKAGDLKDVFFPGELILKKDTETAVIIGGMSDAEIGVAEIPNPLLYSKAV